MTIIDKILCTKTHEFLLEDGENFIVGLTDYAVKQLGDIVYLELPNPGDKFRKGDAFATIESVKAASEIYMPISGEIIETNVELADVPETMNEDCYNKGWLVKIKKTGDDNELLDLLDYNEYKEEVE